MAYAERTRVPAERSRLEIEQLLAKHKATSVAVFTSIENAAIAFEMRDRRIIFKLVMPKGGAPRDDQARRQRWRSLLLAIKAKLASVDDGIETFEDAFLAHIVMPDGSTVAESVRPRIATAYKEGKMQPLLPAPGNNKAAHP